jgi:predicted methyltransferase
MVVAARDVPAAGTTDDDPDDDATDVADTTAALAAIHAMLAPGGGMALLDLDAEDGSFHDEDAPGIHHHGFERAEIVRLAGAVGFVDPRTTSALSIERDGRPYPLFLLTGTRR